MKMLFSWQVVTCPSVLLRVAHQINCVRNLGTSLASRAPASCWPGTEPWGGSSAELWGQPWAQSPAALPRSTELGWGAPQARPAPLRLGSQGRRWDGAGSLIALC